MDYIKLLPTELRNILYTYIDVISLVKLKLTNKFYYFDVLKTLNVKKKKVVETKYVLLKKGENIINNEITYDIRTDETIISGYVPCDYIIYGL